MYLSHSASPSDHQTIVAKYTFATAEDIKEAIEVGLEARKTWETKPLKERADILLHAADLLAGKYRMKCNAATMLGQGKNIQQVVFGSDFADLIPPLGNS
ncbi:unnamed protein product [Cylicostephanus goldi]|uniref:Aldehyde dehydrogenase domain-containing protein n=1 Tax=Cylicostephanus goldi TaxID=71465 RepID=A0A3P7NQD1_CYLGO|nr:unnamed protein product [Cylicostephanus goldi]